jgi:hypothetical protein
MNEIPLHQRKLLYHVSGMENIKPRENITYRVVDETELKLDIYMPDPEPTDTLLPGVVFIHGGPLPVGMKPQPKDWLVYRSYGRLMAASSLIGITLNYRNYKSMPFKQGTLDVLTAFEHVRCNAAEFHLDADNLCVWLFSGGGLHLCHIIRNKPSFVKCKVAFYPLLLDLRRGNKTSQAPDRDELGGFSKEEIKKLSSVHCLDEAPSSIPANVSCQSRVGPVIGKFRHRHVYSICHEVKLYFGPNQSL